MRSEHSACLDEQLEVNWSERLQPIAERLNPLHAEIFRNFEAQYYWSSFQCEWATDVLLRPRTLERLEPLLLRHGLLHFSPPDILRSSAGRIRLGGTVPERSSEEITTSLKVRILGVRLKHWLQGNSLQGYG